MNDSAAPAKGTVGDSLTWREFETMVGLVFRQQGYSVKVTSVRSEDGVNLEISRAGRTILVHCQHWHDRDVEAASVRELAGLVTKAGADGGFIVTSSSFTEDAWTEFHYQEQITLIDGLALKMLVAVALDSDLATLQHVGKASPQCPICRGSMAETVSQRGADSGTTYWACADTPCEGKRSVRRDISWAAAV